MTPNVFRPSQFHDLLNVMLTAWDHNHELIVEEGFFDWGRGGVISMENIKRSFLVQEHQNRGWRCL